MYHLESYISILIHTANTQKKNHDNQNVDDRTWFDALIYFAPYYSLWY